MVNFCKSCGQAIRREENGWVHYDSSIPHNVIPVSDVARFNSQNSGKSNKDIEIPEFEYTSYWYSEYVNSRKVPDKVYWRDNEGDEYSFSCPNCGRENPLLEDIRSGLCVCGQHCQRIGTILYLSNDYRILKYAEEIANRDAADYHQISRRGD